MNIRTNELKPTKTNLIKTLLSDSIDRNESLKKFVAFCNQVDFGCSIAIDGRWGDGKTFFVKQTKLVIDSYNDYYDSGLSIEERDSIRKSLSQNGFSTEGFIPQVTVYYDAWKNDNDEDPLLSIIYEICRSLSVDFPNIDNKKFVEKAVIVAESFTGKGCKSILNMIKGENPVQTIENNKTIEELIADFLNTLLYERGDRIVVIIDELDRCRPTYAVQLLERIKHYFDNDRITFIFSTNLEQLQHSIGALYGNEFDSNRYLDRFFDYKISLPPANMQKYYASIGININNTMYSFDRMCELVATHYSFALRETEKYIRTAMIAAYKPTHRDSGWGFADTRGYNFGFMIIVPLMVGLRMVNPKQYYDFIEGNNSEPLIEVLKDYQISYRLCANLLNEDESYDKESERKKKVLLEDKLQDVYDAIFNKDMLWSEKTVGNCEFSFRTKIELLKAANLLSEYADY